MCDREGTACDREGTERTETTESLRSQEKSLSLSQESLSVLSVPSSAASQLLAILNEPIGGRGWRKAVFRIARGCKAIPQLADAPPSIMVDVIRQWHMAAGLTHPMDDTAVEILTCWDKVTYPLGQSPLEKLMDTLKDEPLPEICGQYESPEMHRLIVLCRELQRQADPKPFFLSCRMASTLIHVDRMKVWRYLKLLEADGVLVVETAGTKTMAARYRYVEVKP